MLEEEKKQVNTNNNNSNFNESRLQFKIENQRFLEQRQSDSQSSKPKRFESVFDTLRILEHKDEDKASVTFKWVSCTKTQKSKLLNKQIPQCQQCRNKSRDMDLTDGLDGRVGSLGKFPRNAMLKSGFLYILKIPESMHSSFGEDSQSSIMLTHSMIMSAKKQYCIYQKGKIYRFESENAEYATKVLDIRNCTMDLTTVQRPDQTVAQSASCNLEQAIQVTSLNRSFLFLSSVKGEHMTKRRDIQDWFNYFKKYGILLNMKSYYEVGNLLGKGNFAKVYEATNYITKEKYALKTIEKKILSKNRRNFFALLQEVTLLRRLDHGNIIHLHEVYESENNIHLILEYLNGGELFERIKKNGSYNEKDASIIMRCILDALVAMHKKQVVHRDLKPENLLFKYNILLQLLMSRNDDIASLKIVDFGLSALIKDTPLSMRCGSPGYVAPEILNDLGYGTKADIFSAGIILYILLTGKFVFSGKNYREILLKNKDCMVPFPPQYWSNLTLEAKDLVKKMLEKDPENRFTAQEALDHPWFTLNSTNLQNLQLTFEEVDDLQLTDEEPSLINSVNLQLVTTSPIWNKSKMRDMVRKVNAEQDKMSTFQTPLPNPKFGSQKRPQESQQKVLKGVVVQTLYNNKNSLVPEPSKLDQFRKQHQTPNLRSSAQSSVSRVQNSTLNMLRSLFRSKEDQKPSIQDDIKEIKEVANESLQSQSINNESEVKVSLINEDEKIQEEEKIPTYNQYLGDQQNNYLNVPSIKGNNLSSSNNESQQDLTQTSTPNQQPQPFQQNQQMDTNYERVIKKWVDPSFMGLSRVIEDAALEDARSVNTSQLNGKDSNLKALRDKADALRQQSVQQARNNMLLFDKQPNKFGPQGQSMHHQHIDNLLFNSSAPSDHNSLAPQPYVAKPPQQLSPNSQSKFSQSPKSFNRQQVRNDMLASNFTKQVNTNNSKFSPNVNASTSHNNQQLIIPQRPNKQLEIIKQQHFQVAESQDSIGDVEELEIEESASGHNLIDQNKIVDFNAHSNNCLLQCSRSQRQSRLQIEDIISPIKRTIEFGNLQTLHPHNASSASVNSNSFLVNSKQVSNCQFQGSSSATPIQDQSSNSNFSSANQIIISLSNAVAGGGGPQSMNNSSSNSLNMPNPNGRQKAQKKSQFWGGQNHLSDVMLNEEANVDGQIDTEEQLINNIFHVPTTPGSVYGGSRNIMKHTINAAPFNKYLQKPSLLQQQQQNSPGNLSSQGFSNHQSRIGNDLQQNITFNNSIYFNPDQSNSDTPVLKNLSNGQQYSEEESKDFTPTLNHNRKYQNTFNRVETPLNVLNKGNQVLNGTNNSASQDSKSNSKVFNATPDGDSSQDGNHHLFKQFSDNIHMRPKFQAMGKQVQISQSMPTSQEKQMSNSRGREMSNSNISSAGGLEDGKSFHTAYQSLADIQDYTVKNPNQQQQQQLIFFAQNNPSWGNNTSNQNSSSINHPASSSNNKSLNEILPPHQNLNSTNPLRNGFILQTEQNANISGNMSSSAASQEYCVSGGGTSQDGSRLINGRSNLSQEIIKNQNPIEFRKGQRIAQVNNLRKTLINNI